MLKQLQQERPIETATVSPHPPHILVASVEHVKAILKLVGLVLFLEILEGQQFTDMWHALVNLTSNLLLVGCICMVSGNPLVDFFLRGFYLLLGHLCATRSTILLIIC